MAAKPCWCYSNLRDAPLAQLSPSIIGALNSAVECHLHTVEVAGSNPAAPTKQINNSSNSSRALATAEAGWAARLRGNAGICRICRIFSAFRRRKWLSPQMLAQPGGGLWYIYRQEKPSSFECAFSDRAVDCQAMRHPRAQVRRSDLRSGQECCGLASCGECGVSRHTAELLRDTGKGGDEPRWICCGDMPHPGEGPFERKVGLQSS